MAENKSSARQEQEDQIERKGFLKGTAIGVALGGILGAVGGILFAPQSGAETRAQIARGLKKSAHELDRRVEQIKASVSDFSDAAGKDLSKLMDRAAELKDEIINFSKLTAGRGGEITEETRKEARRLIDESAKIAADLDRVLARKLGEAKDLAKSTGSEVRDAVKKNTGRSAGGASSPRTSGRPRKSDGSSESKK